MNLIMSDVEESIMIVENPENPDNPNIKVGRVQVVREEVYLMWCPG